MTPPDNTRIPPAVQKLIPLLGTGRNYFERDEIDRAKRRFPMTRLLRVLGDEAFLVKRPGLSPFPSAEPDATFEMERIDNRWTWRCQGCGSRNDQIDYVRHRFNLTKGDAIKLFCLLGGIELNPVFDL